MRKPLLILLLLILLFVKFGFVLLFTIVVVWLLAPPVMLAIYVAFPGIGGVLNVLTGGESASWGTGKALDPEVTQVLDRESEKRERNRNLVFKLAFIVLLLAGIPILIISLIIFGYPG
jgi:hypothetical protein